MPRLFVAAYPPPAVLDLIDGLPRPSEPGVRWVPRQRWHVTLRFLGEAGVDEAADALGALAAPPARAVLGPAVSRLGRDVVCLPVAGLDDVAGVVRELTAGVGEPVDARPFAGHVTLGRLRHRGSCRLAGTPFSAAFDVGEVVLVRSTPGAAGTAHDVVARWPLAGGG